MKKIIGIQALLGERDTLPPTGWIFVDKDLDKTSLAALDSASFYLPEDEDDEFYGEDHLGTWLEAPTFRHVLALREKNLARPAAADYARAAIHYIEKDDFLE